MAIPIKKELNYPAFAVWGTKRGKKVFFHDQFDEQETTNSVDKILTDLRDSISNPSTITPFYSLEKKGTVCIFSIYTSINDWLGRSGYYAVSLLMYSNQEFKGSSIVEALKYFSAIYYDSAIKNPSQQNRISEYTDEEANKVLFQKEFTRANNDEKYRLDLTLDSQFYNGTEKAYFNYDNETEIDTFFKNRNHTDIEKYQTIYFVPKKEETQTALICIHEVPAFKPIEKPKTEFTAEQEASLNSTSRIDLTKTEEPEPLLKKEEYIFDLSKLKNTSTQTPLDEEENNKGGSNKTEKTKKEKDAKPPTEKNPKDKEPSFFDKLKEKKGMIILAILIPVTLVTIGVAVWYFTKDEEGNKTELAENASGFKQQQLDTLIANIDRIATPILDTNWKWSTTEYNQALKEIAEKDSQLPKSAISEIEKDNLRTAQNYSKAKKTNLTSAYNLAITKRAKELIASTEFDFVTAREILAEMETRKIDYPNKEMLAKYKAVSFRIYQAKELIKQNKLYEVKDANETPITDAEVAAAEIDRIIGTILNGGNYNFLESKQKCHLKEWSNILKARQHKSNIKEMIEWVVARDGGARTRGVEITNFLDKGECTNKN